MTSLSLNIYPVSITIFLVVMVCGIYPLMIISIAIFKGDVILTKYIIQAKLLWCYLYYYFKTDVMMMKYIVRVEPPLMCDINRTRGHDVKEVVLPIGWRRWRKRGEPEREIIIRREESCYPERQFVTMTIQTNVIFFTCHKEGKTVLLKNSWS